MIITNVQHVTVETITGRHLDYLYFELEPHSAPTEPVRKFAVLFHPEHSLLQSELPPSEVSANRKPAFRKPASRSVQ